MKKWLEKIKKEGKIPSWGKYVGLGISALGLVLFWIMKMALKKDDLTSFIVLIVFFVIGSAIFFFLDKVCVDANKKSEERLKLFFKSISLSLRAGDEISTAVDKGKNELGDEKLKEKVTNYLNDGTGSLNNSSYRPLLEVIRQNYRNGEPLALATYIDSSLAESKNQQKGKLGYLGLIALVIELAVVIIAVYANNMPK